MTASRASLSLRSSHGGAPAGAAWRRLPAAPAAADQLRHQVEHHQAEGEQHAGDRGRRLRVLDREPHQRRARTKSSVTLAAMLVTGSGEALMASRLPALTRWESSAVPPPTTPNTAWSSELALAGEQDADHGAGRRPDRRRDHVPGGVDVGDLVGDELHRVEERRDASTSHRPSASGIRWESPTRSERPSTSTTR